MEQNTKAGKFEKEFRAELDQALGLPAQDQEPALPPNSEARIAAMMDYKLELIRMLASGPHKAAISEIRREVRRTNDALANLSKDFADYRQGILHRVFR